MLSKQYFLLFTFIVYAFFLSQPLPPKGLNISNLSVNNVNNKFLNFIYLFFLFFFNILLRYMYLFTLICF